jgi:pimeloyl-ACP methyl ester carboxylesterase
VIPPAPPPERFVALPNVGRMWIRDSGPVSKAAGTVLLLHGWGGTSDLNWGHAYGPLVAAGYRVVAVDHRGHGHGLRPRQPFRLEDCADDAAAVIGLVASGPMLVVGHSMGAAIAMELARRHPDRVSGLVLMAAALRWPSLHRLPVGALQALASAAPGLAFSLGARPLQGSDPERNRWIRTQVAMGSIAQLAEAVRELRRFDARPWAASIGVPAAVLLTEGDRLAPPGLQRELAEVLGARTWPLEMRHGGPVSQPADFPEVLVRAVLRLSEERL